MKSFMYQWISVILKPDYLQWFNMIPKLISGFFLLVGLLMTGLFLNFSLESENHLLNDQLQLAGERLYYAVYSELETDFSILESINSFFIASEKVNRDEFALFVRPLIEKHRAIHALEWIPRVVQQERRVFENEQQSEITGFRITERHSQGEMINRQTAAEYFPVTFVEPMAGNEAAVGFDLASNKVRLQTLNLSRKYRKMMATGRIHLVQETKAQFVILVFLPVFQKINSSNSKLPLSNDLIGFALGIFRIGDLIIKAREITKLAGSGILVNLYDRSAAPGNQILYTEFKQLKKKGKVYFKKAFSIAGRDWELVARASPSFIAQNTSIIPWLGLILGIIISILLSAFVYTQLMTNLKIKVEVGRRTLELQNSEIKTKKILETSLNGMITIDSKGSVTYLNPAAEEIFQYRAVEVIGNNVKMLMPDPYHSHHDQYLENYHQSGVKKIIGFNREVTGRRKDGTEFPMRLAVGEMKFEGIKTFVGVIVDITARKKAEKELIASKELAEEANQMKTEFLNTMSHELRTPLTVILGNISELTDVDDLPDLDDIADIAGDIENAGDHLLLLINDLLDLSKIEADKMKLDLQKVGTLEIVGNSVGTLNILAEKKGIKLIDQATDFSVAADPIRLKQILMNLIGNAIKFTDQGTITISVESAAEEVTFHVSDTGCGIEAEDQKHVFDPFRQVDSSSRRKSGGSGLGLAITKKLVELHGGKLSLKSILNQGSTFSFSLPIFQESSHENTGS